MLDQGSSSNVMTKRVMERLNLRISMPYHNVCAMDSREIEVHGLIKDLQVHLDVFLDISILMDVVVIDVPYTWGMLLSRKWATNLGGSLPTNFSYATIPTCDNTFVILNKEQEKKYHVEDPKEPMYEIFYEAKGFGNYAILSNSLAPIQEKIKEEKVDEVWKMNFYGAHSRSGKGAGIVITSPTRQYFIFSYRLEF